MVSRGAKGGATLLLAGSVASSLARPASADTIPDGDLAYARLLVATELLTADFYARAIASKRFSAENEKYLNRGLFNEKEHYGAVSGILSGAGQAPATAEDFDFSYPKGAFASKSAIARLGITLETMALGAYLGAVDGLETDALKLTVARVAASEAQHLSVFARLAGKDPLGVSFPTALTIDEASNALDAFTS